MQPYRFYYFDDTLQNRTGFLNLCGISFIISVFFIYIRPQTTIYKQKNATKHKNSHDLQVKNDFITYFNRDFLG